MQGCQAAVLPAMTTSTQVAMLSDRPAAFHDAEPAVEVLLFFSMLSSPIPSILFGQGA